MLRRNVLGMAAVVVLSTTPGLANADPVVPQTDAPCRADLSGTMTLPTGARTPLVCTGTGWEPVTDPYPISDRWLSAGPAMTLHGQGRRNPMLMSGEWTATPLDPGSHCRATQIAAIPGSPTVGPPQIDQADAGVPLTLEVVPSVVTIELSGNCLWQKAP